MTVSPVPARCAADVVDVPGFACGSSTGETNGRLATPCRWPAKRAEAVAARGRWAAPADLPGRRFLELIESNDRDDILVRHLLDRCYVVRRAALLSSVAGGCSIIGGEAMPAARSTPPRAPANPRDKFSFSR